MIKEKIEQLLTSLTEEQLKGLNKKHKMSEKYFNDCLLALPFYEAIAFYTDLVALSQQSKVK
jgi:hypothetical protein